MISLFCFHCSKISTSVEGLRCPHCDSDECEPIMVANFYSAYPEYGNVSPGYYGSVTDAGNQISEEDFVPVEPTPEVSTQTSNDEYSIPLQIAWRNGNDACTKSDSRPTQNKTKQDLHQPKELSEQSSFSECQNKCDSEESLSSQGTIEPAALVSNVHKLDFKGPVTYESEYLIQTYFSDSSENAEARQEESDVTLTFPATIPPGNPCINKGFLANLVTGKTVAHKKLPDSNNLSKRICRKCRRYFLKEWTFKAHISEDDCLPVEDASLQISEEFVPVEPTAEASTQTSDDEYSIPLQIARRNGNDSCSKSDSAPQNETAHDLDQYNNEIPNSLPANLNTNEGEFHNQSYDICYASTLMESTGDPHVDSQQQREFSEQSSFGECKNKCDSEEWHSRQGAIEPAALVNNDGIFDFKSTVTYEPEYIIQTYFSESSDDDDEARKEKGDMPLTSPTIPPRNPSINKRFLENLVTRKTVAHKKPQTSNISKRICEKCRRYFLKEWTFKARMQYNCNRSKLFKCNECDEKFPSIANLINHRRVHGGEKPFKCNQCDYASAWAHCLKKHLKRHTKMIYTRQECIISKLS